MTIQIVLCTDIDGAPRKESYKFIYAAVVVIIHNLSSNTQIYIKMTINQVSRHTCNPKLSHNIEIKHIFCSLRGP